LVQLYTFRTFPPKLLSDLASLNDVFIFNGLHESFSRLSNSERHKNTELIGFALNNNSRQEQLAINRFNSGKIEIDGPSERLLNILPDTPFSLSEKATHTFCNWTMYKLSKDHKVSFFHINIKDWESFVEYITGHLAQE